MESLKLSFETVTFFIFSFAVLLQLVYYLFFFSRLAFQRTKSQEQNTGAGSNIFPPASIVIAARNEDDNLVQFLPLVLNQDYPDYEVVVVNDCSYDNTGDVLKEFQKKFSRLKVVTIREDDYYKHGKKMALMVGIKGTKHEHLLFTDADCVPQSRNWLRNIMKSYSNGTEIVLGYGAYQKTKGLLNKLIRYDTFFIALQYISFALARGAYMGVGRNLSYKKSLFFKNRGFASHYHLESGDDDLFVNETAKGKNVSVQISPESFTVSKVKKDFRSWFHQKRRHITTGYRYKPYDKFRLFMLMFSQWLFFVGFISLLVLQFLPYVVIPLFFVRLMVQLLIFKSCMKKLGEQDLLFLAPVFEIFLMLFYPTLVVSNAFMKKNKWKMN
jgi:glycosyltransferase involved in cell wall biosynthesis